MEHQDLYELLQVARDAQDAELKRSYRALAKRYHPDLNPAPGAVDLFREIAYAYHVLSNERLRGLYDRYGHAGLQEGFEADEDPEDWPAAPSTPPPEPPPGPPPGPSPGPRPPAWEAPGHKEAHAPFVAPTSQPSQTPRGARRERTLEELLAEQTPEGVAAPDLHRGTDIEMELRSR